MSRNHVRLQARRWARLRVAAFRRDGYRCRKCGLPGALEADHVTPIQRGGKPYDLTNIQTLCRGCHIAKTRAENVRRLGPEAEKWRALVFG